MALSTFTSSTTGLGMEQHSHIESNGMPHMRCRRTRVNGKSFVN